MKIDHDILYAQCPCGSGKKFKFCCYPSVRDQLPGNPGMEDVSARVKGAFWPFSDDPGVDKVTDLPALRKARAAKESMAKARTLAEAAELFREARTLCPNMSSAWDCEATCLWHVGDFSGAIEVQRESLARSADGRAFGWAQLAQFEYAFGNDAEYERCAARAMESDGVRTEFDATKVCECLALARRHEDICRCAALHDAENSATLAFLAAVASANLKRWDDARRLIGCAIDNGEDSGFAYDLEDDLAEEEPESRHPLGEWPYFDIDCYPPGPYIGYPVAERRPEHRNVVCDLAEMLLDEGRITKADALEAIASYDGGRASKLREFLAGTDAYDEIDENEFTRHRTRGDEIAMQKALFDLGYEPVELSEEASTSHRMPDNEDLEAFCDATTDLLSFKVEPGTARWNEIRNTLAALHEKYPDHVQCWMNYAGVFEREGRLDVALPMVEAIFKAHPDYVFAAAAIAKSELMSNNLARAGEIVRTFRLPPTLHPDAYRAWLKVKAKYCMEAGDTANLMNALDALTRLDGDIKDMIQGQRK